MSDLPHLVPNDYNILIAQADQLEQMTRSEGWKVFLGYVKMQRQLALTHIENASSGEGVILRASGALAQLRELATWPEKQAEAFRMQAKQLQIKNNRK